MTHDPYNALKPDQKGRMMRIANVTTTMGIHANPESPMSPKKLFTRSLKG